MHLNAAQTGLFEVEDQKVRRNRTRVRRIEIEMRSKDSEAFRVRGFERQDASIFQFVGTQPHQRGNLLRMDVFDHLRSENSIQAAIGLLTEVDEGVGL